MSEFFRRHGLTVLVALALGAGQLQARQSRFRIAARSDEETLACAFAEQRLAEQAHEFEAKRASLEPRLEDLSGLLEQATLPADAGLIAREESCERGGNSHSEPVRERSCKPGEEVTQSAQERQRLKERISELMEIAIEHADNRRFEKSAWVCDEILAVMPGFRPAQELKDDARRAAIDNSYQPLFDLRREKFRSMGDGMLEIELQLSEGLRDISAENRSMDVIDEAELFTQEHYDGPAPENPKAPLQRFEDGLNQGLNYRPD